MRREIILSVILVFTGVFGCERATPPPEKATQSSSARNQDQEALAEANRKIEELSSQLEQLRTENRKLTDRNEILVRQQKEFEPRVQQLISGYGTGIWDYTDDGNYPVFVKAMKGAGFKEVIAELNKRFRKQGQPELRVKKKDQATIYLTVSDEELLGERMGSHGASAYLEVIRYSLASVNGIECVYFDIGEGDHAVPGKYCRDGLKPQARQ